MLMLLYNHSPVGLSAYLQNHLLVHCKFCFLNCVQSYYFPVNFRHFGKNKFRHLTFWKRLCGFPPFVSLYYHILQADRCGGLFYIPPHWAKAVAQIVNDKTRPMSDGSGFNDESGKPRKTLFGVEARFFDSNVNVRRRHQMEVAAQQREQGDQRLMRESDSIRKKLK